MVKRFTWLRAIPDTGADCEESLRIALQRIWGFWWVKNWARGSGVHWPPKRLDISCCFCVLTLQFPSKCLFCQVVSSRALVQHPSGEAGFPGEVPKPRSSPCPLQTEWLPEMRCAFLRLQRGYQTSVISATEWSGRYFNKKLIFLRRWKMNSLLIAMITFLMTCL